MNSKLLNFNDKSVLVVDAPIETTHSQFTVYDGASYIMYKKSKLLTSFKFDDTDYDEVLVKKYDGKIVNIGKLSTADESIVADLFTPVKNGNFWEYQHNGVFYPQAISALKDIIDQEVKFENPFLLVINS